MPRVLVSINGPCPGAEILSASANKMAGKTEDMEVEEPILDEPAELPTEQEEDPPVKEKPKPKPTKPQRQLPW